MKILARFAALVIGLCLPAQAFAAATILPPAETCFQALTPTSGGQNGTGTGLIGLLGSIVGGGAGTSGTYGGVALTGGHGTGATANITVTNGSVTAVVILNPGQQYIVGDILSANSASIGNVVGFSVPIQSIYINYSLAGGQVYFYIPSTNTPKTTWLNAAATSQYQNTNPVQLDANGCAIIYGTGSYREVLQDALGNTIWDQVTTDVSANNSYFWAGVAGGSPNTITITDAGFNGTDGTQIAFTALSTNTGAATLNPSSFGAIPIKKDTTTGPVSLSGGEIVANNPISVVYRVVDNAFHILNPVQNTAPSAGFFTTLTLTGSIIIPVRIAVSTTDNISATKDYFICAFNSSAAATETLPSNPSTGLTFLIKDCSGNAGSHTITIVPTVGTIDGAAEFVMGTAFQSVAVTYTGTQWNLN